MAAVYFVTGLLLLLLGIGNAVMALSATIDIAFIVKSLNPTDLFSTPSVLGNSMIITGILSIIQYFTPTNAMLVAIYIFNIHTLTLLPISIFTSIYYYATIPRLNLATRQSIAIFAVIVLFYLSTIIISVYIAMQYFTDFITSRHYHKLSDLKEEQNSDRSINEGEIAFRLSSTKKIRNVAIFQLICSGVLIASGLADLFLFQGLYSNQTFYAGSLLCVTSICGILSEHKNIDEGMIWFGILSRVSRLICISTIGINVLAYLNTSAAALYEDPDNIRSLFICVSVMLVLGFLTSFYITLKLTSNIGFFNVISVWKKRRAEQSYKPELCSLTTVLSTIQFLAALFLWASGVAAMLYGKAQHLSFSTFSTASWVIVAAKVGVSLNRMKSVQIATNTRKLTKDMGSRNMLTANEDNNEQEDSRESAN
ncbi:uncharacterized protein TRIADDRAFT_55647 [Trichoplax adhaerens]|uniref:Uncharacterized protein n=1 Tax=Trichoplax adhaerens TaxID=10228 RepID=B3RVG7_TRIAD|nr:predicted protein [Trichoplax adhaerens]EDV25497.1 predicted protein [Trichoplax adhaerens]|eukprot:XP_002111530.1 predicted protein [Trichoplax adhaerens]